MIGVFDSGYGGLTVFRELDKKFPKYDLIYFGDNARAPYGSRDQETTYKYTREAVDWLFENNCELVILACNTASSQALRKIQQDLPDKKVLGVLIPIAEAIAEENPVDVGILATKATVESGAYLKEIKKLKPDIHIIQQAAPLLVSLIEEDWIEHRVTKEVLKKYLEPFKKENIKNIVLGCTHYPFIKHLIQAELPNAKIFDSPSIIPISLENYLARHPEIEKRLTREGKRRYITTDDPKTFKEFAAKHLKVSIEPHQISI